MIKEVDKRRLFLCANQWCRELVERYGDINYRIQLGLCIKELLRQKRNGEHNLF